jgi:hypothetical protein
MPYQREAAGSRRGELERRDEDDLLSIRKSERRVRVERRLPIVDEGPFHLLSGSGKWLDFWRGQGNGQKSDPSCGPNQNDGKADQRLLRAFFIAAIKNASANVFFGASPSLLLLTVRRSSPDLFSTSTYQRDARPFCRRSLPLLFSYGTGIIALQGDVQNVDNVRTLQFLRENQAPSLLLAMRTIPESGSGCASAHPTR